MSNLATCQFCFTFFTPPTYLRVPSLACDRCFLEIRAGMETDDKAIAEIYRDWKRLRAKETA